MSNIKSVTGTNEDGISWTLAVGDRVTIEAHDQDEDSADAGVITGFVSADEAVVKWDSCGDEMNARVALLSSENDPNR